MKPPPNRKMVLAFAACVGLLALVVVWSVRNAVPHASQNETSAAQGTTRLEAPAHATKDAEPTLLGPGTDATFSMFLAWHHVESPDENPRGIQLSAAQIFELESRLHELSVRWEQSWKELCEHGSRRAHAEVEAGYVCGLPYDAPLGPGGLQGVFSCVISTGEMNYKVTIDRGTYPELDVLADERLALLTRAKAIATEYIAGIQ